MLFTFQQTLSNKPTAWNNWCFSADTVNCTHIGECWHFCIKEDELAMHKINNRFYKYFQQLKGAKSISVVLGIEKTFCSQRGRTDVAMMGVIIAMCHKCHRLPVNKTNCCSLLAAAWATDGWTDVSFKLKVPQVQSMLMFNVKFDPKKSLIHWCVVSL